MGDTNNKRFYVYLHRRGDTNEVFYVGKGSGNRAYDTNSRSTWWTRIYNKCGRSVEFVEIGITEDDAFDLEVETIRFYRECGHPLCNLTDGGEGTSGYKPPPEVTAKIVAAVSKPVMCSNGMVFKSCVDAGEWLGKKHVCAKISKCCRRESLTCCGYVWRYVSDSDDLVSAIEQGIDLSLILKPRGKKGRKGMPVFCSNGMRFDTLRNAAAWLSSLVGRDVHATNVSKCCKGKRKTLHGFKFSYEDIFKDRLQEAA